MRSVGETELAWGGEAPDLLFHQTISPLSEGNIFDLDLGVALCFSFVLPLKSLHSIVMDRFLEFSKKLLTKNEDWKISFD